jgi:ribosomal protein L12E/L44/L45/RPP1/RPP2
MEEEKDQEIHRRLLVLFKNHDEMAKAYVAQFGSEINIKNIQAIRAQFPEASNAPAPASAPAPAAKAPDHPAESPPAEGSKEESSPADGSLIVFKFNEKAHQPPQGDPTLESPLYPRVVDCPICKKWGLNSLELRAKSLSTLSDPFLAPVYISPGQYQAVNYLLACITVCDGCLVASPDRRDFNVYNRTTRQNQESQLPPQVIRELKETTDKRKAFFEKTGIGDELFKIPRSHAAAIVSYQFADMRAEIEAGAKVLGAHYKRGNYWTRIALLCRQVGMDDKRALEIAAEHFKNAFMLSDFPKVELEYQTLYILFNIFLYFGRQKEARDYLTVLDKTKQELEKAEKPPEGALPAIRKWIDMGKNRWEDREMPNFWKTPGID